jgi:predicted nucleic acid-binding protein
MIDGFWDTSALVPLLVKQKSTPAVLQLSKLYGFVVWWSTPVEAKSAFARPQRTGQLTPSEFAYAQVDLAQVRLSWREVLPSVPLRGHAESFVDRFQLRAAHAQQLAAAYVWALGRPAGRVFISGDAQLLEAARQLGFQGIQP